MAGDSRHLQLQRAIVDNTLKRMLLDAIDSDNFKHVNICFFLCAYHTARELLTIESDRYGKLKGEKSPPTARYLPRLLILAFCDVAML
jgi:hypothetical protein